MLVVATKRDPTMHADASVERTIRETIYNAIVKRCVAAVSREVFMHAALYSRIIGSVHADREIESRRRWSVASTSYEGRTSDGRSGRECLAVTSHGPSECQGVPGHMRFGSAACGFQVFRSCCMVTNVDLHARVWVRRQIQREVLDFVQIRTPACGGG